MWRRIERSCPWYRSATTTPHKQYHTAHARRSRRAAPISSAGQRFYPRLRRPSPHPQPLTALAGRPAATPDPIRCDRRRLLAPPLPPRVNAATHYIPCHLHACTAARPLRCCLHTPPQHPGVSCRHARHTATTSCPHPKYICHSLRFQETDQAARFASSKDDSLLDQQARKPWRGRPQYHENRV